ncbi:hypothetical protein ACFQ07_02675 [Actinomadura adrarensis]|uniref:Glycosyltransferase RgtA/B/C/D-like domain-containing protein n=1 Tax=Actinomadura adrarensis TaxID=1819600 RepID=A0ABW3C9Z6_9ACTN
MTGKILRHVPFLVALLGGVAVRWTVMLGYPGVLWFTGDSYFYLGRALRSSPSPSKTLGYSFFLDALEAAHSLALVAGLQHAMGLAVAVMVYVLLCRAGLPAWLAALFTLPVLYDAYQVQLEHLLMSEALFTFLIAASLALLLWRTPAWWMLVAAGLLLGYAVLVRSAGAPLIPVVFVVLLLRRGGWRHAPLFGAAAAVPLLAYMAWFHGTHGTYGLTTSDGIYLWGRTAPFAECAEMKPPSHMEGLCLTPELRAKGEAPGRLIWTSEAPPRVVFGNVVGEEANRVLREFAIRAMVAQPGAYLGAIGDGVGMAFSPERFPHPTASTEALYHFSDRRQLLPAGKSYAGGVSVLSDAVQYEGSHEVSRVVQPYADRMIAYQERVYLPGPLLGVLFGVGAVGVLAARDRRAALMVWGGAVVLLVFPIASADFDYRYVLPTVPFACLAAGLAFSRLFAREELGEMASEGAGREREAVPAPASRALRVSRWWGSPGSRRRAKGPASEP